ncbi:hypothetical protein DFH29DRAFT_882002 [Suillus ampliporus]|nr:hypothetical protein DFH29DRAFT_882002 [Suillus ampliporus]
MFMRFHGGGVSHQVTQEWDEFLQNDSAVVSINDDEDLEFELGEVDDKDDDEDDKDDEDDGEEDGDNNNNSKDVCEDGIDDEDQIRADDGEELDDNILAQEGYGALLRVHAKGISDMDETYSSISFESKYNGGIKLRAVYQDAIIMTEASHLHSIHRNNEAITLDPENFMTVSLIRFKQWGVMSDLDEAIEHHRAALLLHPSGHSDRSASLNNLAVSLTSRFKQWGVPSDLDEAIELHRAALLLRPPGHSDRSGSLNNLAISLQAKFEQRGVPSDFDEAIELHQAALLLRPPGDSDRSVSLNNLANGLTDRFKQRGVLSDLDEAIEHHQAALLLHPPGHSDRSASLNNLAVSLTNRFKQQGVPSDLDEAIEHHWAALLLYRFKQQGVLSDIDEAIEFHRAALHLRPPTSLHNLAIVLQTRFEQRGVLSDLDEAIELYRAALLLRPPGHHGRSASLHSLAISLIDRFEQRGVLSDLDEASRLYLQLSYLSHAACSSDLRAAKAWVTSAEKLKHGSTLIAYQTALKFLDQHVALLSSSSRHFDVIREATSSLATDAFSYSIRHELVEQGRAVFWTQLAHFCTPLDELSLSGDTGAALAEELKRLSFCLHKAQLGN